MSKQQTRPSIVVVHFVQLDEREAEPDFVLATTPGDAIDAIFDRLDEDGIAFDDDDSTRDRLYDQLARLGELSASADDGGMLVTVEVRELPTSKPKARTAAWR